MSIVWRAMQAPLWSAQHGCHRGLWTRLLVRADGLPDITGCYQCQCQAHALVMDYVTGLLDPMPWWAIRHHQTERHHGRTGGISHGHDLWVCQQPHLRLWSHYHCSHAVPIWLTQYCADMTCNPPTFNECDDATSPKIPDKPVMNWCQLHGFLWFAGQRRLQTNCQHWRRVEMRLWGGPIRCSGTHGL
jgi:hypothetical protein